MSAASDLASLFARDLTRLRQHIESFPSCSRFILTAGQTRDQYCQTYRTWRPSISLVF
jgi:hypothetical protein